MKLRRLIPIAALALLLVGCGTNKNAQSSTQKSPEIAKVDKILATKGQEFSVDDSDQAKIEDTNKLKVTSDEDTQIVTLKQSSNIKINNKQYGIYSYTASGKVGLSGVGHKGFVVLAEINYRDRDCLVLFGGYKDIDQLKNDVTDIKKGLKGNSYYIDKPYYIV